MCADAAFADMAHRIAHQIAGSAIWCDDRCNWVAAPSPRRGGPVLAALGPDLYGGTGGVALWLAVCGARLDDQRLRATAVGAIRTALDHAGRNAPAEQDGLYEGPIGVAYAAARIAALLGADDIRMRTGDLLRAWQRPTRPAPRAADVMSGCAGAIVGLLALRPLVTEPWLLEAAVGLGDELISRHHAVGSGWSWAAPGKRAMHHLCGYAHGAAGIGHAFAELHGVTGEPRFLDGAERAFTYERSWLDVRSGTWPDLRGVARPARRDAPVPTSGSWCNGAAGIAVSRIRAAELLATPELKREAELALMVCERDAVELLDGAPEDVSLCHGAGGTADVLLYAPALAHDRRARLAAAVARWAAARTGDHDAAVGAPGLVSGRAGVGMLYLRLFDPRVLSPLLVVPGPVDSAVAPAVESSRPGQGGAQ